MVAQLSTPDSQPKAKRGFALLITITLLAFLVVLLVGLAAYTRVETAVAGNTQRQAQARQNALMALNVALGELQKYAGPDQRVAGHLVVHQRLVGPVVGVRDPVQRGAIGGGGPGRPEEEAGELVQLLAIGLSTPIPPTNPSNATSGSKFQTPGI